MKRRILSIITALALCLSLCPTWAFATEADPSLCKHHPAHTADCGYAAPTEGHDCGHEHTEDCYTTDEAGGKVLDCQHSHNSECGYVQADPGTPCGYVCRICPIEDLIAALPEQVTEDNADDVRAQLDKILALYRELDEGEQEEIDLSRCYELQEALDNANAPMQAAGEINISQNRQNILTEEDGGCQGHTFTGTAQATMIYVESGVHDVTFANLNITAAAKVGVAPGATMNLTIRERNTISAGGNYAGIYVPKDATLVITNGSTGTLEVSSPADAGIGGAWTAPDNTNGDVDCGTVVINGGTITAAGGGSNSVSAGIGGSGGDDTPGNGGTVIINGGTVTATGGSESAGYYGGAGIGGSSNGESGNGGTLTISGGHVTLAPGAHNTQWGTAYGFGRGSCTPNASTGTCELTLADASYLDSGTTLDPKGKYTINGDPTADMIVVPEDLIYSGKAQELAGRIYIDDSKTGTGTYFGQTFTVNASADGWVLQDLGEVVEAKEYTATFTKGDQSISKKFTVAKSGTQFVEDGEVKTYNGETQTDTFTAGDTITVKATPTPTGKAPDNSAMFAASFTAPGAGQMAVFVNGVQVSEPADAGADGVYTMTVRAADVLLAANGPGTGITLTAKFVENNNMADGTGTATVNITAAAKAEKDNAVIGYYGESGLDAAFEDSGNAGATFTLLADVERTTALTIKVNCILDLNGKTIRSTGADLAGTALGISSGATVTIRGEGTFLSEHGHGLSVGGTATLEGGTFISGAANCGGVYVQAGKLIVTGEAVVIENTGGGIGLGVNYGIGVTAQLSAGTYGGGTAAIEIYQGTGTLAGLLNQEGASRVAYYKDNTTLVTEGLDGQTLPSGSYTVKACTHTGEGVCTYTHNENTSTHTKTCLACGKTWDAEDCDYGEYTHNDTGHTRICKLCEYQNVEAHNIKCTAEASGTVIAVSEACKTCGYGKDLGTVTIHIPKLVYGDLTGVVTAENTLTEPVSVAGNVKNPGGETVIFSDHATIAPPTMATLTGNALLSAGEHKIKINIVIIRDENALAECELTFNVDPAPLPEVTLSAESATYNGTEQKPALSVQQGETALTEGTDYEVSYTRDGVVTTDFTNAGTVNITVTGKGNYTGSVEKTYTIGKATPTIAWANKVVTLTYTGQPADIKPVVTLVNGETFSGTITYHHTNTDSSESGESKAGLPTNAGIYVVGARIPEQDNYTAAATAFLMLTINKADQTVPAAPTAAEDNIKDNSITLDAIENAEYKMGDGEWQESPTFTGLEPNQAYTFYARLKADDNHNASLSSTGTSITTRKAMLENASVTITGTYTYTGAAIVPEAGNVEVVLNGTKIDSDQYTISASNNINAGVGKATLTVTATETGNYSGSVSSTFTIAPATLYVAPNSQTIRYGEPIREGAGAILTKGLATGDHVVGVTLTPDTKDVPGGKIIASEVQIQNESGADVTGNYEITYVPGALIINKSQPTIAFADGYNPGKTYDGQTIPNPVEANLTITGATFGDVAFAWSATPKNAGTYTLTASIPVTDNTEAAEAVLTVTIRPKTVTPTITITPSSYEYTGSAIHPSGSAVKVMDGDTVIPDSEYTLSYGENTQVGTGSVTVTDKENGNYTIAQTTETFTITKANQATLTITGAPGSVTYGDTFRLGFSGGSGSGAVSWAASGATVDNAGNVTITRVGTVIITAVKDGDSNYSGTEAQIMLNVSKKALTVTGATAQDRQYDGTSAVKITGVTLEGIVNGDTVSVSTADLTGTLNGSNVGSYTAVTLPALTLTGGGADNYTLTRPAGAVSTSVTISKADALTPKTGDLAVANNQAHTYTFGLGALRPDLPAGMSFGSSAVTYTLDAVSLGSYYDSSANSAKIEGQTLTLPIEAVNNDKAEGIGTITVTIHTGNFEDMTATINVRSVNKTIPTGAPTLSAATLTYGHPLSTITLSGSMKDGSADVPGIFTWSSPDNRPAVQEKYAAAWTFKPDDNDTYAIVTGTALIQVLPAPITGAVIVLEPAAFRYDGTAHRPSIASVTLDATLLTADVDYTAEIPEGTEAGSYTVTLTGKGNYTGTATATFTINPVEQKPLDQTDDDGHELRLEVETGLSTVPEALKNNAKYDTPAKIEAELRTQVEQVMSNVGGNIAVFDVTLQYKDASGTWHNVDPNDFPTEGVTAILPYPDGTGATGYTFTVQHLISSGTQAGTIEPLSYTLTADGLQCKFLTLSPVAIGYQAAAKPVDPVHPNPGGNSGGGGGGVSTYAVTVEKSEHGKVTSNRTNAGNGSTVTLTVTPEDGYVLDTLTVTDSRGNAIKLTAQGNGKYTFTMPGRAVTVRAAFAPLPDGTACDGGEGCPSRGFTDLGSVGTWYHEAVDYVLRNNLMGGYGNGLFGPNNTLTRAQFAQILFNKEGRPVVNYLLQFTDVSGEAWYTEAVRWAASQGIVGGYADGRFGPNDNITREQLAVMLWRYAGSPAATDKELHFNDADKVGAYARDAIRWAVENGVISGKGGGILDPKGLATRAQTAQMLKNYLDGQSE